MKNHHKLFVRRTLAAPGALLLALAVSAASADDPVQAFSRPTAADSANPAPAAGRRESGASRERRMTW